MEKDSLVAEMEDKGSAIQRSLEKQRIQFEKVSRIEENIQLPERSTKGSAGYDFFVIEDTVIEPFSKDPSPTMVPTGVKVQLPEWTFLMLANRSSNPGKLNLVMPGSIGVIDSDYYNNPDNEGEMFFSFYNVSDKPVFLKKATR